MKRQVLPQYRPRYFSTRTNISKISSMAFVLKNLERALARSEPGQRRAGQEEGEDDGEQGEREPAAAPTRLERRFGPAIDRRTGAAHLAADDVVALSHPRLPLRADPAVRVRPSSGDGSVSIGHLHQPEAVGTPPLVGPFDLGVRGQPQQAGADRGQNRDPPLIDVRLARQH